MFFFFGRLLPIRVQCTWAVCLFHTTRSVHVFPSFILSLDCHTHSQRAQSQSEVSLNHYSCSDSHSIICSELVQLTLRKAHNYADSQANSQAGPQAYRCLGWHDREVVVRVVKPKVDTTFGDDVWNERRRRYNNIRSGTSIKITSIAAN